MRFIGIDPGKTGGVTVLGGYLPLIYPMPSTEQEIMKLLKSWSQESKCIIEAVHAFPGQGVTSMFTFGKNYGFLRGCLVTLSIPFIEVTPQKWMNYFGLKKSKTESKLQYKKRILQKAQNLYPDSEVTLQTADSLMLAEYLASNKLSYWECFHDHTERLKKNEQKKTDENL